MFYLVVGFAGLLLANAELMRSKCDAPYRIHDDLFHECGYHYPTKDPTHAPTHVITTSADGAYSVFAIDVDGDGDIDVLSASRDDETIAWYENDGKQGFTTHVITTAAIDTVSVFAIDVDGDGDIDVLSASISDDKIAWYENDQLPLPSTSQR